MKAVIASITILLSLSGCADSGVICDEKSSEVSFARSIGKERLAKVFEDVKVLKSEGKILSGGLVPAQFSDLKIKTIRVHTNVHLRLKGCFDHHIDLVVYDGEEQKIELRWGEHKPGKEVLWKK